MMGFTKRTLENLAGLNSKFRAKVEAFLQAAPPVLDRHGVKAEVISGLRSWRQQEALYAQGRTKPGRIVVQYAEVHGCYRGLDEPVQEGLGI